MAEINIHNLCRICLKDSDFHSDIYNERLADGSLIMELINDLLQLDVELDDGLPNFLCSNCYNKMTDFELFKRFAHECRAVLQCIEENTTLIRTQEEGDDHVPEYLGNPTEIFLVPMKIEEFDESISTDKDPLMEESLSEASASDSDDDRTLCLEPPSNEPFNTFDGDQTFLNEASCSFNPLAKHSNSAKSIGRTSILKEAIHSKSQPSTFPFKENPVLSETLESGKTSECDLLEGSCTDVHIVDRNEEMHKHMNAQECAIIGESVLGRQSLDVNEKEFDEPRGCICDICGQVFITNSLLIRHHKNEHPGMKPFKCKICEKFFSRIQNLRQHSEVHSVQNPLESNVCSDQFVQQVNNYGPQTMQSAEKPFKCDICEKFFTRRYNLKIHRRIHFRERPYKCLLCEKSYTDSSSLRKHQKRHTGEHIFKCYTCQLEFDSKCTFELHVRTHTVDLSL